MRFRTSSGSSRHRGQLQVASDLGATSVSYFEGRKWSRRDERELL